MRFYKQCMMTLVSISYRLSIRFVVLIILTILIFVLKLFKLGDLPEIISHTECVAGNLRQTLYKWNLGVGKSRSQRHKMRCFCMYKYKLTIIGTTSCGC